MSNKLDRKTDLLSGINSEFTAIFAACKNNPNELELATEILRQRIRKLLWWGQFQWICAFACLVSVILYVPLTSTHFSALFRIFLVKLLPFWDWRDWSNEQCLVGSIFATKQSENEYQQGGLIRDDCAVCESYDLIAKVSNITFSSLEDNFIIRALPVIIEDSHHHNETNFLNFLSTLPDVVHSTPCNLQTNLMKGPISSLATLFDLAKDTSNWFLHFRNCDFPAIKESRALAQRLYYLSSHLSPFFSSWILVSNNYTMNDMKALEMRGIVVVLQLYGSIEISLDPKEICWYICEAHTVLLNAGQALLYSSELWEFSYKAVKDTSPNGITTTFVEEIEWFK